MFPMQNFPNWDPARQELQGLKWAGGLDGKDLVRRERVSTEIS